MITIGAMIGAGKSSLVKILGEHLEGEVFYENVEENPVLPLFYTSSEEEIQAKRYPFLSQLYFLKSKYQTLKAAGKSKYSIVDRSIYEDWYFAKVNREMGRISELEYGVYEGLLKEMLEEIEERTPKSQNLFVYLTGSFETILQRIQQRGRGYELDESLVAYYRRLWEGYNEWIDLMFREQPMITIDIDQYDYVNCEEDRKKVLQLIDDKLQSL